MDGDEEESMTGTSAGLIRHGVYLTLAANYLAPHVPGLPFLPAAGSAAKHRLNMNMNTTAPPRIHKGATAADPCGPPWGGYCPVAAGARIPPACVSHVFFQPPNDRDGSLSTRPG